MAILINRAFADSKLLQYQLSPEAKKDDLMAVTVYGEFRAGRTAMSVTLRLLARGIYLRCSPIQPNPRHSSLFKKRSPVSESFTDSLYGDKCRGLHFDSASLPTLTKLMLVAQQSHSIKPMFTKRTRVTCGNQSVVRLTFP